LPEVHYVTPYSRITGKDSEVIPGKTLRDVLEKVQHKYIGLDPVIVNGKLNRRLVVLIDRRSALTLEELETRVNDSTEILIMKHLGWA